MSTTTRNKRPTQIRKAAPKGEFRFPKLTEVDYGTDKFPKPAGEYSTRVRWKASDPAFAKFRSFIDTHVAKAATAAAEKFAALPKKSRDNIGAPKLNPPFSIVYDEEENDTGYVEAKFKMNASGVRTLRNGEKAPWTAEPILLDRFGRRLKKGTAIWSGSVGQVCFVFEEGGYFVEGTGNYGLSLRLEQAILHEIRGPGQRSTSDYDGVELDEYDPEEDAEDDTYGDGAGGNEDGGASGDDPAGSADF